MLRRGDEKSKVLADRPEANISRIFGGDSDAEGGVLQPSKSDQLKIKVPGSGGGDASGEGINLSRRFRT